MQQSPRMVIPSVRQTVRGGIDKFESPTMSPCWMPTDCTACLSLAMSLNVFLSRLVSCRAHLPERHGCRAHVSLSWKKAAARLQSALVLHLTRSLLVDKVMSSAGTSRFSVICCFSSPMLAPSGTWIRSRPSLDDVSVCHGLCKKGSRMSWGKQAQDIRVFLTWT